MNCINLILAYFNIYYLFNCIGQVEMIKRTASEATPGTTSFKCYLYNVGLYLI